MVEKIGHSFSVATSFPYVLQNAASPTIGDVKALNKLARQLKSEPVKLQFWPLTRPFELRIVWQIFLTKSSAKADNLITAVKTRDC